MARELTLHIRVTPFHHRLAAAQSVTLCGGEDTLRVLWIVHLLEEALIERTKRLFVKASLGVNPTRHDRDTWYRGCVLGCCLMDNREKEKSQVGRSNNVDLKPIADKSVSFPFRK